jgi:hypothetical protein
MNANSILSVYWQFGRCGIGKLPALAGRLVFGSVFLYCKIWQAELHFVKFCGNSFFVNSAGTYFSLKRGAWSVKKGAEASLWGKKGVPVKCTIPKRPDQVFLRYRLVKYRENTNQYQTKIPNQDDATLDNFSALTSLVFSGICTCHKH